MATMQCGARQRAYNTKFISGLMTGNAGFAPRIAFIAAAIAILSGCSITQVVEPVKATRLSSLCILDNKDVLMDEFQPEMQRQIAAKGIPTRVYSGARPQECSHYLEYTAHWQWDLAVYLVYADLRVYDHTGVVGTANYNARNGGARVLDKFGRTAEKLRPLVDQLFGSVRAAATAVPVGAQTNEGASADRLRELQALKDKRLISDDEYDRKRQEILRTI